MAQQSSLAALVAAELKKYPGLDPRAVLAVAAHEGLGGGIGDNGTSFGPFQLHYGGAFPSSAPHATPQQAQAWASSPQGIDYALGRINSVAGGLKGVPAIQAISSRFERPANVGAEVADAAARYGAPLPAPAGSAPGPQQAPSPSGGRSSGILQLLLQHLLNEPAPVATPHQALDVLLAAPAAASSRPRAPAATPSFTGSSSRTPSSLAVSMPPAKASLMIRRLSSATGRP
jgi:hypothetical protein